MPKRSASLRPNISFGPHRRRPGPDESGSAIAERSSVPTTDPVVVNRRIRDRIIEYLALVANPEAQIDYQSAVPIAHVPSEIINQWEDWVFGDRATWSDALSPEVYSRVR